MSYTPTQWEDQAVSDIIGANLPALAGFEIEVLSNQVDFEKDQINHGAPYLLIAWVEADHERGYIGADPFFLAFTVVVPGGSERERRGTAINAVKAIADWMRTGTPYQPKRSVVERIHPSAIVSLTAIRVG